MSLNFHDRRDQPLDRWTPNPLYYDFGRPFPTRHVMSLFEKVRALFAEPSVIWYEPGVGTGRIILPLAERWPDDTFVGVDTSSDMLDVCRYRAHCNGIDNLQVSRGDLRKFTPPGSPNIVIISSVLHTIPDWIEALYKIAKTLHNGGIFALVGEQNDLCDLALGRQNGTELYSDWPHDEVLTRFWAAYFQARCDVGARPAEQSQVGAKWSLDNTEICEALVAAGFSPIGSHVVRWKGTLNWVNMNKIISERCFSSMFSLTDDQISGILDRIRTQTGAPSDQLLFNRSLAKVTYFARK